MPRPLLTREQQIVADLQRDDDLVRIRDFLSVSRGVDAEIALEAFNRLFPQQETEHYDACN